MRTTDLISRRSLLRGIGAGSVLLSGLARTVHAETNPGTRAAFFFHANGSHPFWTPTGMGSSFTLSEHLKPLEPLRNDILIFRDMILQRGSGNSHKSTTFSALGAGGTTSFDQLLAKAFPGVLPSLELAIGFTSGGGGVTPSLSQVDGVFLPGERNPVTAFARVADVLKGGSGTDPGATARALAANQSLLDYLNDDIKTFNNRLGAAEKHKAELYIQSLRDLETSLHKSLTESPLLSCGDRPPDPAAAANIVARVKDMPDVNRLFLDVMATALACGVTRVTSMMWGGGQSDEEVPFVGMGGWHNVSHEDPAGPGGQKMIKMTAYLAGEFAYFCQKLKSYPEGNGTVLDNTMALWSTQNGFSCQVRFAKEDHDVRRGRSRRRSFQAGQGHRLQQPQPQRSLCLHCQCVRAQESRREPRDEDRHGCMEYGAPSRPDMIRVARATSTRPT
jgi:hypothetical protein